jgi:hypothetical protein
MSLVALAGELAALFLLKCNESIAGVPAISFIGFFALPIQEETEITLQATGVNPQSETLIIGTVLKLHDALAACSIHYLWRSVKIRG